MTDFSPASTDATPVQGPAGDFLVVARFHDPLEAQVLKDLLRSEDIPATLGDLHQVQANTLWATALGGVRLMVPAKYAPRARELMAEMQRGVLAIEGDPDPALPPPIAATDRELWNPDLSALLSAWLTPAFGATLLALNARTLGDREMQRAANFWLVLSAIITGATLWLLRDREPSIGRLFEVSCLLMPYTILWYFFGAHAQSSYIARQHGRRYVHLSMLKAALPAVLLILLVGASGVLQPEN